MIEQKPAREAPAPPPTADTPEVKKAAASEPMLCVDNIQGNILGGFMKDHQMLIFLKITDVPAFKKWLKTLTPFIATAGEVLAFNRLFKALRTRRGETNTVKATWNNIAFSFGALKQLAVDADAFTDAAFRDGLASRSQSLGDPADAGAEGNPGNWFIGGPNEEADVVLIVASDDRDDLFDEVARIEDSIFSFRVNGQPASSGAQLIYKQQGQNLPGSLAGHEHFGFLDGVSQPGIRGLLPNGEFLTLRQNPQDDDQGKPGQDLLWPGEFVFGYSGQDPEGEEEGPNSLNGNAPAWAQDGSFLVFRRLRQDVFGFHSFLRDTAGVLGVPPDLFGAKLVGRWPSGAPILRAQNSDDAALADNDCANNNFEFQADATQEPGDPPDSPGAGQCAEPGRFPESPGDKPGIICPYAGHIRKTYPRDDVFNNNGSRGLNENTTQTHRLLRRGIPFGEVSSSTTTAPFEDTVDRGLLFLAYQTSVVEQFEFVTKAWVNNANFKEPFDEANKSGAGHDPIIGQNGQDPNRERKFIVTINGQPKVVSTQKDWVIPTGGGYFFSPSIDALCLLAGVDRP
jgi:Dyp-type peroxidase family